MTDRTKRELAKRFEEVLSLGLFDDRKEEEDPELVRYVLGRIEERAAAKKAKDFKTADAIRDELFAKGVILEDTREGVKWKKA